METNYRKPNAKDTLAGLGILAGVALVGLVQVTFAIGLPILVVVALWKFVFG